MSDNKWTKENIIRLIELYENEKCLWDTRSSDHKNKIKRTDAFIKIANDLNFEEQEVRKKMDSLLTQYRREKKALVLKSGMSSDDLKTPWYAYKYFYFLNNKNDPRKTRSNTSEDVYSEEDFDILDIESVNEDNENDNEKNSEYSVYSNCSTESPKTKKKKLFISPKPAKKVPRKKNQEDEQVKEAYSIMTSCYSKLQDQQSRDELKVYGESVEFRLRKIQNPMSVCLLKNQIDNLLFQAEMDQYNQVTIPVQSTPLLSELQPTASNSPSPQSATSVTPHSQQIQSQDYNMRNHFENSQFY